MSYQFYKVLHFIGLAMVIAAICLRAGAGSDMVKRVTGITHGVGLLIMLVAGFGLIARLELHSFPGWIWAKLVVWLLLGASLVLSTKKKSPLLIATAVIGLTGVGAYLAGFKPF